MPELSVIHIGMLALMLVIGVVAGWLIRADRCAKEKLAANAELEKQLDEQQTEHDRLAEQNRSLMEQLSQFQASHKDHTRHARELTDSLKDSTTKRDQLQRQLKDMRQTLEAAVAQRDKLRESLQANQKVGSPKAIKEKDEKIFRLSRELTSWQSRVPPLVERFQTRDREARELAEKLEMAEARIEELEELTSFDQTRIEAMDAASLPAGGSASNEPEALTSHNETLTRIPENPASGQPADSEPETDSTDSETSVQKRAEANAGIESEADNVEAFAGEPESNSDGEDGDIDSAHDEVSESGPVVESGAAEEMSPDAESQVVNNAADDLKMITGIGPAIEKTLNDMGIHRFQQIAEISEYEIDKVAQQLRGFRSRIYREDWIGQARDLHHEKNGRRS
jgi:predicted flap endonuclease-1-like 5' DNA nuclease/chaperonin cofactor prefoldin